MSTVLSIVIRSGLARLFAGLALLACTGCVSVREGLMDDLQERKYFTPTNFVGEPRLPVNLHRVLLLPVCGGTIIPPETSATLEEIFATELQRQLRFEVVRLTRAECQRRFGAGEFSSSAALPHDFLTVLGHEFDADAVLFVDITSYKAYRPLALGLRAKLATVDETRLLWTFDEIFSADDQAVGNSVKRYFGAVDSSGIPTDPKHAVLQSPGKFAAYVASATFSTLPPR